MKYDVGYDVCWAVMWLTIFFFETKLIEILRWTGGNQFWILVAAFVVAMVVSMRITEPEGGR